jgi:hypothetical protein
MKKTFYLDQEVVFLLETRMTQPGEKVPRYGAQSELVNTLLKEWLQKTSTERKDNGGN